MIAYSANPRVGLRPEIDAERLVYRRCEPVAPRLVAVAAPRPEPVPFGQIVDAWCRKLLELLEETARAGQCCPSNRAIGEALGGLGNDYVNTVFRQLKLRGAISIPRAGRCRQVVLLESGLATAPYPPGKVQKPKRAPLLSVETLCRAERAVLHGSRAGADIALIAARTHRGKAWVLETRDRLIAAGLLPAKGRESGI